MKVGEGAATDAGGGTVAPRGRSYAPGGAFELDAVGGSSFRLGGDEGDELPEIEFVDDDAAVDELEAGGDGAGGTVQAGADRVAPARPAGERLPTDPPQGDARYNALEARLNEVVGQNAELRQIVDAGRSRQPSQNARPTRPNGERIPRLEELRGNPNATIDDIVDSMQADRIEDEAGMHMRAASAGQRAASQAHARGRLNAAALGEGYDYDSVRRTHLEPAYRLNPNLETLIANVFTNDFAMGEYLVGSVIDIIAQCGDDPVKAFNAMRNGLQATTKEEKRVKQQIVDGHKRGAQRVLRSAAATPGAAGKLQLSPSRIAALSDDDYRAIRARHVGPTPSFGQ